MKLQRKKDRPKILSEDAFRRQVRQRSKKSLYYFASAVLQMEDLIPELHLPFANFIQMSPFNGGPEDSLRKLAWMPRGHFKSSIISVAYPLWLLIHDRNTSIALISSVEKNTKKWLEEMRNTIEHNTLFQWAFGEIVKGDKWEQHSFTIARDREYGINTQPSVVAYTIKGGLASAHHPHIILDDPLNEQTAFSEGERERAIELYIHLESIISKYEESMFTLVGTPWPGYDVIQHAMEFEVAHGERLFWGIGAKGGFECTDSLREAHPEIIPHVEERLEKDGVIFHEVCPQKKLDGIKRRDLNQYLYQYLCSRPDDEDNGFDLGLFRPFALEMAGEIHCECHGHGHHLRDLVVVAICDPALSVDPSACESALSVVGRDPNCGCRFKLYEWGGRVHDDVLIEQICIVANMWAAYLRRFAIEDVHFQALLKSFLLERQSDGRFPLGIEVFGVKPKKRDKDLRIAAQQAYVANGYWHARPSMRSETGKENFMWQLQKWPNQPKKRDRIDAWAYCDDVWEGLSPYHLKARTDQKNPIKTLNKQTAKRQLARMKKAREA